MLEGLDAIVIDLQDVGARFYTYMTTMAYVMEEAAKREARRSSCSIGRTRSTAVQIEGPGARQGARRLHRLPAGDADPPRHDDRRAGAAVQRREQDRRGPDVVRDEELAARRVVRRDRPAVDQPVAEHAQPECRRRSIRASARSSTTNISVGRGTDTPFEQIGAPWIDGVALAEALNAREHSRRPRSIRCASRRRRASSPARSARASSSS